MERLCEEDLVAYTRVIANLLSKELKVERSPLPTCAAARFVYIPRLLNISSVIRWPVSQFLHTRLSFIGHVQTTLASCLF